MKHSLLNPRLLDKMSSDLSRAVRKRGLDSLDDVEKYLAENKGKFPAEDTAPQTPLERAQDLVFEASGASGSAKRARLARKALKISPDCADAYNVLAGEAETPEEASPLYEKAVAAGERALGKKFFKENAGRFWAVPETRPYMRARADLSRCLWTLGDKDAAIRHLFDLLRLNPNDNQGLRYILASILGEEGRFDEMHDLLEREEYGDDCGLDWLMLKGLSEFVREGPCAAASGFLSEAFEQNAHLPLLLVDVEKPSESPPPLFTMGGKDEATLCLARILKPYYRVPGAVDWLARDLRKHVDSKASQNAPRSRAPGKKHKKRRSR